MPSLSNKASSAAPTRRLIAVKPTDFAFSIACLKASVVLRSGFGAPLSNGDPDAGMRNPARAHRGIDFALLGKPSSSAAVSSATSKAAPYRFAISDCADVPKRKNELIAGRFLELRSELFQHRLRR